MDEKKPLKLLCSLCKKRINPKKEISWFMQHYDDGVCFVYHSRCLFESVLVVVADELEKDNAKNPLT